jgi:cytochrome c5
MLIKIHDAEKFPDGRSLVKVRCTVCHDEYWTESDREICVWQIRAEEGRFTLPEHRKALVLP